MRKAISFTVLGLFFIGAVALAIWSSTIPYLYRYDDTVAYKTTGEFYQIMSEIPMSNIESITIKNTSKDLPSNLSESYIQIRVKIKTTEKVELPFSHGYSGFWGNFLIWFFITGIGAIIALAIYPHKGSRE